MSKGAHFEDMPRCPVIKSNGEQCKGRVFKDHETCAFHDPENKLKAAIARDLRGASRKYPDIMVVDNEDVDDYVVDNLQNVIAALKGRNDTDDTARVLTQALSTLDRALDRRAARGADVTVVEVVYVNDWRAD